MKELHEDFKNQLDNESFSPNNDLLKKIKSLPDMNIRHVFERIYDFNRSVLSTNVDSETKNCNA